MATSSSIAPLQTSAIPSAFKSRSLLSSASCKRLICRSSSRVGRRFCVKAAAAAAAAVESNGAVAAPKIIPEESDYGRKFFPLAAVIGQVDVLAFLIWCVY